MRLVTYTVEGEQRVGALVEASVLDLAALAEAEPGNSLPARMQDFIASGPTAWARARGLVERAGARLRSLTAPQAHSLSEVKLLAPIPRPLKNVFCLGYNYREHFEETHRLPTRAAAEPKVPIFFTKAVTSILGPDEPIPFDESVSTQYDWEAELGVVIGIGGRGIGEHRAMEHVFGYTCFNDVSVRDVQTAHGQWFLGKSLDGTCPFGPAIVTADEVPNPQRLAIQCRVNGTVKQSANTGQMIFGIPAIIAHLSRGLTLEPGDLISTGTPSGVGMARNPPEWLKPGDMVEVEIEKVGLLRNPVTDLRELEV